MWKYINIGNISGMLGHRFKINSHLYDFTDLFEYKKVHYIALKMFTSLWKGNNNISGMLGHPIL